MEIYCISVNAVNGNILFIKILKNSPQLLVATILSHRYNSRTGSGETKVESHASSDTQPNQAALLLNTARIQPGSQPHQCVGGNTVHLATFLSAHRSRWCAMRQGHPYRPSPP
jgi:hypothetical protein